MDATAEGGGGGLARPPIPGGGLGTMPRAKAGPMPAIKDLPIEHLRTAGTAIETVLDFSAYLPRVGRWLRLAGEFRDDIRKELGMPPLEPVSFGPERKQLDDLPDDELLRLGMAVYALAASYGPLIEDRHLTEFIGDLLGQIAFGQAARIFEAEAQAS